MGKTYIFCGQAQLPYGTDIYEQFKYITVLFEIDMETEEIVNCYIPVYCAMCNEFMSRLFKGQSLKNGLEPILERIEEYVHLVSKKALINALQALYNRYMMVRRNMAEAPPPKKDRQMRKLCLSSTADSSWRQEL